MRFSFGAGPAVALTMAIATTGCATVDQRPVASADLVVLEQTSLPPPSGLDQTTGDLGGMIGPLDRVSMEVFGVPELRLERVEVDGAGRISIPLLGTITVAGRTPAQVAEEIAQGLRQNHIRNPRVTINVVEGRSRLFTIEGEVREPGHYPVLGGMTLLRAVASAKGTSEFARMENVVLFRTVGNQRMAALYDLRAIQRGIYPDPAIYQNDVIVVGNDHARRIFRDVIQLIPALASPLVVLLNR